MTDMSANGNSNGAGPAAATGRKSIVDEGTTFKGAINSNSTVLILGVLEGEVTGPAVEVERGGTLNGKARVTELRSRGELAGEFEADDVELGGSVRDKTVIRAKALRVGRSDGQGGTPDAVFGECQIEVGDPPSKEEAIRQAMAAGRPEPSAPVLAVAPEPGDDEVTASGTSPRRKRPTSDRPSEGA
jgi:cytoskeletal protein CcmA (bactofilin family)